jgi:hypothetical protein
MDTLSSPLAAYCSHGNSYRRFQTTEGTVTTDVEYLLTQFGAPLAVRMRIQTLLASPEKHYPSGFRFESSNDHHDPERTVVYACLPIEAVDGKLKTVEEGEDPKEKSKGAWRRSA